VCEMVARSDYASGDEYDTLSEEGDE